MPKITKKCKDCKVFSEFVRRYTCPEYAPAWSNDAQTWRRNVQRVARFDEKMFGHWLGACEKIIEEKMDRFGKALEPEVKKLEQFQGSFVKQEVEPRLRLLWLFNEQFYHFQATIDLIHRVSVGNRHRKKHIQLNFNLLLENFLTRAFSPVNQAFVVNVVLPLVVQLKDKLIDEEYSSLAQKSLALYMKILHHAGELTEKPIFELGFACSFFSHFLYVYEPMDYLDKTDHRKYADTILATIESDAEQLNLIRLPFQTIKCIVSLVYDTYVAEHMDYFTSPEVLIARMYKGSTPGDFLHWLRFLAGHADASLHVSKTFKHYFQQFLGALKGDIHRGVPYAMLLEQMLKQINGEVNALEALDGLPAVYKGAFIQALDNAQSEYMEENFLRTVYFYTKLFGNKPVVNIARMLKQHPDMEEVVGLMHHFFYIRQLPGNVTGSEPDFVEQARKFQASVGFIDNTVSVPVNAYIKERKSIQNSIYRNPEVKMNLYVYPESLYKLDDVQFAVPRRFQKAYASTVTQVPTVFELRLRKLQVNHKFSSVEMQINFDSPEEHSATLDCSLPVATILLLFNKNQKLSLENIEAKTKLPKKLLSIYMNYLLKMKLLVLSPDQTFLVNDHFIRETEMKPTSGRYTISDHYNFPYIVAKDSGSSPEAEAEEQKTLPFFKIRLQALIIQLLKRERVVKDIDELKILIEKHVQDKTDSRYNYLEQFKRFCLESLTIADLDNLVVNLEKISYLKYEGQQIVYLV